MENKNLKGVEANTELYIQLGIIAVLALVIIFNFGKISSGETGYATGIGTVSASEIIPKGVPAIYGSELKISYDDVSPNNPSIAEKTIALLGNIDVSETLTENELQRYI